MALEKTLERCNDLNLTLIKEKCQFSVEEITFFGNEISFGIRPTANKFEAFLEARDPANKIELQSFFVMTSHFSSRIINKANNASCLYDLLKKSKEFNWTEEHSKAIKSIKENTIIDHLAHFDDKKETELLVDAGPTGVSAILIQKDDRGNKYLISCASHAFSETEKRYSQVEKEMLAPVWGCEHYSQKLLAREFTLSTDNKSVKEILYKENVKPSTSKRINSWMSNLTKFNYKPVHIPGKINPADYISRFHNSRRSPIFENLKKIYAMNLENSASTWNSLTIDEIVKNTNEDEALSFIKSAFTNGIHIQKAKNYFNVFKELSIHPSGLILKNDKIVLPNNLRVIEIVLNGHLEKSLDIIKQRYYFPKLIQKITLAHNKCNACEANTGFTTVEPIELQIIPKSVWEDVEIDFSSKTPSNYYLLVIVDKRSRYLFMKISKNLTSQCAIKILKKLFEEHGTPKMVRSDNGPAFKSHEFATFAKSQGFKHIKSTPLWPRANGMVESKMKIISKSIRCAQVLKKNWMHILDAAIKRYRAARHPATGYTPNQLMNLEDEIGLPNLSKKVVNDDEINLRDEKYRKTRNSQTNTFNNAKPSQFKLHDK